MRATAWADRWWDEERGLLWNPPGSFDDEGLPPRSAHLVPQSGWYAAGLLDPAVWQRFLGAYLGAGGPALGGGDPWARLDVPARALTVQLAAVAVVNAGREGRELDDVEHSLIESCNRIVGA